MSINLLSDINKDRGTWKIKVKVIHKWEFKDKTTVNAINLLLADEKVNYF
jgi:hypothetical protein